MKTLCRYALAMMLVAVTAVMAGCSEDDNMPVRDDGKVTLRIGVAGESSMTQTRATWVDTNATDDEMMNLWVVVITYTQDGSVVKCIACRPTAGTADQEIDEVGEFVQGAYTVYSFANISVANVCTLLGLTGPATLPTIGNTPVEIDGVTGTVTAATVAARTVTVNGNNFNPTAADNGFGEKGIPMSNVQTIAVNETERDLIVVRMMAKMEVQVFNDGDADLTIHSISLTDITPNVANNLKLLPLLSAEGANTMDFIHKDIQPNLGTVTTGNMTYSPAADAGGVAYTGHKSTDETKNPVKFTFYVNESAAPINNTSATLGNGSGLFYLTLGIKTGTGEDVVYSHALIDQTGETESDNDAWHYIARNDYRVVPVILTDWLFRVEPLAFVPIAGYPATMLSSDAQKATFSTGGMIALQPFVKKRTEASWRDFDDSEVKLVSIHWTNSDGTDLSGDGKIIKTAFAYDTYTHTIIGELNNTLTGGPHKTAVTITVKLGPTGGSSQYTYSFTFDVILDKRTQ